MEEGGEGRKKRKKRDEKRLEARQTREREREKEYGTRVENVVRLLILGRWQRCDKAIWRNGLLLEPITSSRARERKRERKRGIKTRKDRLANWWNVKRKIND